MPENWMEIKIVVPDEEGSNVLRTIEDLLGLKQIDEDWCTYKREKDNATIDFAPCPEPKNRKEDW